MAHTTGTTEARIYAPGWTATARTSGWSTALAEFLCAVVGPNPITSLGSLLRLCKDRPPAKTRCKAKSVNIESRAWREGDYRNANCTLGRSHPGDILHCLPFWPILCSGATTALQRGQCPQKDARLLAMRVRSRCIL